MGNTGKIGRKQLKVSEIEDDSQLNFYINVDDPNLGNVKIYSCKKMPLCYILKQDKILADSKVYNIFKTVQSLQSTNLLTLYGFKIDRKNCCSSITNDHVTAYWEYYNFYFADYIKKRTNHKYMFVDSQLWHIIQVCSEGYSIFKKTGIFYDIYPQTMVITPQGKLKLCWAHLKSQNSHMRFFKYFQDGFTKNFFYSPQQLQCMYFGQRTTKLDFDKCNTFRLGMILLQCMILMDPLELCYNPSLTKINFNAIKHLINTKVVPSYSQEIISFLKLLLREKPRQRPTLMEIYEKYSDNMSPQNELRVCGKGPNQNIKTFPKQKESLDAKTVKLSYSHHIKN